MRMGCDRNDGGRTNRRCSCSTTNSEPRPLLYKAVRQKNAQGAVTPVPNRGFNAARAVSPRCRPRRRRFCHPADRAPRAPIVLRLFCFQDRVIELAKNHIRCIGDMARSTGFQGLCGGGLRVRWSVMSESIKSPSIRVCESTTILD